MASPAGARWFSPRACLREARREAADIHSAQRDLWTAGDSFSAAKKPRGEPSSRRRCVLPAVFATYRPRRVGSVHALEESSLTSHELSTSLGTGSVLSMRYDSPNRRRVIVAATAAGLLMLVSGIGYRVLAARLATPAGGAPIDPAVLEQFPMQIGSWTGQEVPLDEAIVRATDTDAHLNRRYSRRGGLESVLLYIACGVQARDLMPHRPEVCYTGAGWTLVGRGSADHPLSDGTELPCNVMQFARGVLSADRVVVLYYYIVDGQYSRDVSLLRSRAWQGSGTVDYVAQVQIVIPVSATLTADSAQGIVTDFAGESALPIARLFENREGIQNPDELQGPPQEQ